MTNSIPIFKFIPRLGRIRHLGLFSLWLSFLVWGAFLEKIFPNYLIFDKIAFFFLFFISFVNLFFIKISRLNDCNYSGWWLLLGCIPLIGAVWVLAIFLIPGSSGANRFGDLPSSADYKSYLLIMVTPMTYLILYLLGVYDLT
jgi:uncharacterized membrane protein YhaH (DUF805 family)